MCITRINRDIRKPERIGTTIERVSIGADLEPMSLCSRRVVVPSRNWNVPPRRGHCNFHRYDLTIDREAGPVSCPESPDRFRPGHVLRDPLRAHLPRVFQSSLVASGPPRFALSSRSLLCPWFITAVCIFELWFALSNRLFRKLSHSCTDPSAWSGRSSIVPAGYYRANRESSRVPWIGRQFRRNRRSFNCWITDRVTLFE